MLVAGLHVDRESFCLANLKKLNENTIIISLEAIPQQTKSKALRAVHPATENTTIMFKRTPSKETTVNMVTNFVLGKMVSRLSTRKHSVKHASLVRNATFYFNNLTDVITAEQGPEFAQCLMNLVKERRKGKAKKKVVEEFIKINNALGQTVEKYKFIETLLAAVLENKLAKIGAVHLKANVLEKKDGAEIGKSLAMSLATTLTAQAGVDEVSRCKEGEIKLAI